VLRVAADDESVAFDDNGEWLAVSGGFSYFTAAGFVDEPLFSVERASLTVGRVRM
jgi:hypothetical protein